jgi:hypothetical protein
MKRLKELLGISADKLIDSIGQSIDSIVTNDDEKLKAKNELSKTVLSELNRLYETQASVIKTEMSGNWLQRSWRPLLMWAFGCIIMMKWMGWTDPNISEELEMELLQIIKIGLGGYVLGRSVEKVAKTVTANIDMSFLKKKDRLK